VPHASRNLAGYLYIAPALVFLALIVAVPIFSTFKLSFQEIDPRTKAAEFVGIANFIKLAGDPLFWWSFLNSLIFAIASTVGHAAVGIICALLLIGRWATQPIRNMIRGLLILPWLFSLAAAGLIWGLLYQSTGPVNYLLLASGIISRPIDFFGDPNLAIWSLIFINVWKSFPFYMVMILGALQSIPEELWEAAKMDGANAVQRFWHVTLPMLKPVLIASTAIDMITTVTTFDLVKIMTNGGPMRSTQTLAFYIWQSGFRDVNFGYGAAMSVVMLVTLSIATLFYLRVSHGSAREADAAAAL
jgi:multiple sugar transport system permease protein